MEPDGPRVPRDAVSPTDRDVVLPALDEVEQQHAAAPNRHEDKDQKPDETPGLLGSPPPSGLLCDPFFHVCLGDRKM